MIWSISGHKQFNKCQRRWFYSNVAAHAGVKNDPFRKEVTILARLQTIDAWRGTIVDDIISRLLVNAINKKRPLIKDYFLKEAMNAYEAQLEYAIFQTYRDPMRNVQGDKNFAAIINCELETTLDDEHLQQAKSDINDALTNLLENKPFIDYLRSAKRLVSQRSLTYYYDRFSVKAIPDLIAFFENEPPHIFDWKVHTFGTNIYDEQLISYAAALFKVVQKKPHRDFPANIQDYSIYDYKLTEYQLLHPERIQRDYIVDAESLEELSLKISSGIIEMYMAGFNKKYDELSPENFSTTSYFENCHNCPFIKICNKTSDELRN